MSMFGKVFSALRSAADELTEMVSATRPPLEEFKERWKEVTHMAFYGDGNADVYAIVEDFREMLTLLVEEERSLDDMGPCMEYLFRHGIVEAAVKLAVGNMLPHIGPIVLQFISQMLVQLNNPLLPQVKFHSPLKRLLLHFTGRMAQADVSDDERTEFVNLVSATAMKLADDPSVADCFIDDGEGGGEGTKPSLVLLNAALTLVQDRKPSVRRRAREALLLLLGIDSPRTTKVIVEHSDLAPRMVETLIGLFAPLPLQLNDASADYRSKLVDACTSRLGNWRDQPPTEGSADTQALAAFLDWVLFLDEAAQNAAPEVGKALGAELCRGFLTPILHNNICKPSETISRTAVRLVSAMLTQIRFSELIHGLALFLLSTGHLHEQQQQQRLLPVLLRMCDSMSDEVSAQTLVLFVRLLETRHETVYTHLFRLKPTSQLDSSKEPNPAQLSQRLLDAIPKVLRSGEDDAGDVGDYDHYFAAARSEITAAVRACKQWSPASHAFLSRELVMSRPHDKSLTSVADSTLAWLADDGETSADDVFVKDEDANVPSSSAEAGAAAGKDSSRATTDRQKTEQSSSADQDKVDAHGLVAMVCRRLRRASSQTYRINLLLSRMAALLLQVPCDSLYYELADMSRADSLISSVLKATSDAHTSVESTQGWSEAYSLVKNAMEVDQPELLPQGPKLPALQAMLVLAESCKELAACLLIKANLEILGL